MFKQQAGKRIAYSVVSAVFLILLNVAEKPACAVSNVTLTGSAGHILMLSAGATADGAPASMQHGEQTGARAVGAAIDSSNAVATLDFGDLSKGDGTPITGSVGLRIRSNCRYKVTMSRGSFVANNLQVRGVDVSGAEDGGTFIRVTAGPRAIPTGPDGNAEQCLISSNLVNGGIALSQLSSGSVSAGSSLVANGQPASLRGSMRSDSNAVDLPVNFSCPTGMQIGPVKAGSGSFQATVQFEIFPER